MRRSTMKNEQMALLFSEATPYIQKYHGKTLVIKYGGNAMVNDDLKLAVMNDLVTLTLLGVRVVLVHGGGLPIGAVLMNKKVADHMKPGSHGSTFGGNPVCCAGALAVLDEMDDDFLANVNERAAQLRAGLAKLPHVREVSGLGLMVGIAFDDGIKAADVRAACEKAGLLVLTAKTRLRLLPPLILTADDVDDALAILRSVLEKCV